MKVKNIMFSGFAAAILMGVGAAHAVVANPVTLADQGYVDAKINLVAGQKEAVANKMNATTAAAATLDALAADEDNYPSVAAAVEIADKKAKAVVKDVNEAAGDLATLKGNVDNLMKKVDTEGNVAAAIAGALADAKADATTKADKALADAKTYTDEQITALDLANKYEEKGTAASQIAALDLANTYEAKGEAAKALTDANAYTDAEIDKVEVNVTANTSAITTLNGDGDGSVKKMAADAATAAVNASGHAKQADLEAEVTRATGAEAANKALIDANAAGIKALQDANYTTMTAVEQKGYAVAADVEATYETKESAAAYAKTADVTAELAKKLDKTAIDNAAGTYMVTSDGKGGFTYTQVKVATVDGEGNTTVTE